MDRRAFSNTELIIRLSNGLTQKVQNENLEKVVMLKAEIISSVSSVGKKILVIF